MAPTPDWVKQLKPSGAQGHELLAAERASSNVPVQQLEELLHTKEVIERKQKLLSILKAEKVFDKSQNYFMGRTDRFERALAREKRLRILKKQHNWTLEEFRTATELIGEPGPYGLHDSMFKVSISTSFHLITNLVRSHLASKVHQNSRRSGSLKPTTTRSLVVTLKPSSATVLTSVDWKLLLPGTQMTRHSRSTLPISLQANGGSVPLVALPTMPWSWLSSWSVANHMDRLPSAFRSVT